MSRHWVVPFLIGTSLVGSACAADLWPLAKGKRQVHQFATAFTTRDLREFLATDAGIDNAIEWCRSTGVTKVYLETFRDGEEAPAAALTKARDKFKAAEIDVAALITPTGVGKPSTGRKLISCYTDPKTQARVKAIAEYTAGMFDDMLIGDFWYTDCTCGACDRARRLQEVSIHGRISHPAAQGWEDYRRELMLQLSRYNVVDTARHVNKKAKVSIKFPMWYDQLQDRGYDVVREPGIFDRVFAGAEIRDHSGGPFFNAKWLAAIAPRKAAGGWFDPYHDKDRSFLESARQTILAGSRESVLFSYGLLQRENGPSDIEALRTAIPELLEAADQVRENKHRPIGLAAYKPVNTPGLPEPSVFDYALMLGLPLEPTHLFPEDAPAAFFSAQSTKDPYFVTKATIYITGGHPTVLTDAAAAALDSKVVKSRNVFVINVGGDPKSLLNLPQEDLDAMRALVLPALRSSLRAPAKVGLYLFFDGSYAVENYNSQEVTVNLNGTDLKVPGLGWITRWK